MRRYVLYDENVLIDALRYFFGSPMIKNRLQNQCKVSKGIPKRECLM